MNRIWQAHWPPGLENCPQFAIVALPKTALRERARDGAG
jgi:hypothetical protein